MPLTARSVSLPEVLTISCGDRSQSPEWNYQQSKEFAESLGFRSVGNWHTREITVPENDVPRIYGAQNAVSLLCHRLTSREELQVLLWSPNIILEFVAAITAGGLVVVLSDPETARCVPSWFGEKVISETKLSGVSLQSGEVALLLKQHEELSDPQEPPRSDGQSPSRLSGTLQPRLSARHARLSVTNLPMLPQSPQPCTYDLPLRYRTLLRHLANKDFLNLQNEGLVPDIHGHYKTKVLTWVNSGHSIVVDNRTGIEYFARFYDNVWMMVSIGVQSASDKGRVKLHEFLYQNREINPESLHNRINYDYHTTLRFFLRCAVELLGGPNMALIHDVYLDSVRDFRYIKVELCRALWGSIPEPGDLSYITRSGAGFTIFSQFLEDGDVAASAMRTVYDSRHEDNMKRLFEGDDVPLDVYLLYDIAKAIRVVPHRNAVNRRRYSALLSHRKPALKVPTGDTARYSVERTSRIEDVDAAGRPVRHQLRILFILIVISVSMASLIVFGLSRDSDVNSAELVTIGLAALTLLLVSVPQLYVSLIGGYTIGELYRGIVPVSWALHQPDGLGFLRECLAKGVNVEPFVSGQNATYLLNRAEGNIDVDRVRLKDLDSRWGYGVDKDGFLCMRYRNVVGIMKVHTAVPNEVDSSSASQEAPSRKWWWRQRGISKKNLSSSGIQADGTNQISLPTPSTTSANENGDRSHGEFGQGWKWWKRKKNSEPKNQSGSGNQPVSAHQPAIPSEWRWWSCTVLGSTIVKEIATSEVIRLLGDGEIGGVTES